MLVGRLWLRDSNRKSSQRSRLLLLETYHSRRSSSSPHSEESLAGRNLPLKRGGLISPPFLFFAERESGWFRTIQPYLCLRPEKNRRCFFSSEARYTLQKDKESSEYWEEKIKQSLHDHAAPALPQQDAAARTPRKGCDGYGSRAVADGSKDTSFPLEIKPLAGDGSTCREGFPEGEWKGSERIRGEDEESPSPGHGDHAIMLECLSLERPKDSDIKRGGQNARSRFILENKNLDVLAPEELEISKTICKILQSEGWTESAKQALSKLYSLQRSDALISSVISGVKNVDTASSLFEWACEHMGHNVHIYHAYLVVLGETHCFDEMWGLLRTMGEHGLEISGRTFSLIIRACGAGGAPEMAVDAYKRAPDHGVVANIQVDRALLTTLFGSNLLIEARLFYSFLIREGVTLNTHLFNALIDGFNLFFESEDSESSFHTMLTEGCEPNVLSYQGLMEAYCNRFQIEKAISAYWDLQMKGLTPSAPTMNVLLRAYCEVGRFDDAVDLFANMKTVCKPNKTTFNTLLHGLFRAKEPSKAMALFQLMERDGLTNRTTYIYLSQGLRKSEQTREVWNFLTDLFDKRGYGMQEICSALLYCLCCHGEGDLAESLFKGMLESSEKLHTPAYEIMIEFYSRLEKSDKMLELLSDMEQKGLMPSFFHDRRVAMVKKPKVIDEAKCFQDTTEEEREAMTDLHLRELSKLGNVEAKCFQDTTEEEREVTTDLRLRELSKLGNAEAALQVADAALMNRIPISEETFMALIQCLCTMGKTNVADSYSRALLDTEGCLRLTKEAASQARAVLDEMSGSSRENDRISAGVSL